MPNPASSPAQMQLSLACDLDQVPRAAETVRAFLKGQACAARDLEDCELALVEACNNAVLYAGAGKEQAVQVEASCDQNDIELRITDHTQGFDWPEQVSLPDPQSERGRGLFLICAMVDRATYIRSPAGNTLVLRKTRSKPNRP